jgi:hypothetical protein
VICFAGGADAQPPPSANDLSRLEGTWTLDVARSGATEPERRVVSVGPTWIRVTLYRAGDDRPPVLIYNLDGSSGTNSFGQGTAATRLSRDEAGLRTETVYTVNDRPITVTEVLRLNAAGDELSIETVVRVEHGYQGVPPALDRGAPNVSRATKVFRRVPSGPA